MGHIGMEECISSSPCSGCFWGGWPGLLQPVAPVLIKQTPGVSGVPSPVGASEAQRRLLGAGRAGGE